MMKHSEQINELAAAMSALQSEIRDAEKDTKAYNYKYADLAQILSIVRPLCAKHGIMFSQHPGNEGQYVNVTTLIAHTSGQWMQSTISVPADVGKNAAQAAGSVITYLRRYSISSVFGISQADDCAESSQAQYNNQPKNAQQSQQNNQSKPTPSSGSGSKILSSAGKEFLQTLSLYFDEKDDVNVVNAWRSKIKEFQEEVWFHMDKDMKDWLGKALKKPSPGEYLNV